MRVADVAEDADHQCSAVQFRKSFAQSRSVYRLARRHASGWPWQRYDSLPLRQCVDDLDGLADGFTTPSLRRWHDSERARVTNASIRWPTLDSNALPNSSDTTGFANSNFMTSSTRVPELPIAVNVQRPSSIVNGPSTNASDIAVRSIHDVARREFLAHACTLHAQARQEFVFGPVMDLGGRDPRQELRITLDVDHQVEHLLGRESDQRSALYFAYCHAGGSLGARSVCGADRMRDPPDETT